MSYCNPRWTFLTNQRIGQLTSMVSSLGVRTHHVHEVLACEDDQVRIIRVKQVCRKTHMRFMHKCIVGIVCSMCSIGLSAVDCWSSDWVPPCTRLATSCKLLKKPFLVVSIISSSSPSYTSTWPRAHLEAAKSTLAHEWWDPLVWMWSSAPETIMKHQ